MQAEKVFSHSLHHVFRKNMSDVNVTELAEKVTALEGADADIIAGMDTFFLLFAVSVLDCNQDLNINTIAMVV